MNMNWVMDKPSPWLRGRLEAIQRRLQDTPVDEQTMIVLVPMTSAPEGWDPVRWDRCCDRYWTYVAPGALLFTGIWSGDTPWRGQLLVSIGLCNACNELERLSGQS